MNEGTVTKEQLENYRKHAERCPDTDYVYAFTAQQMNEVSAEAHRRGALEALKLIYDAAFSAIEGTSAEEFTCYDNVLQWCRDVRKRYETEER